MSAVKQGMMSSLKSKIGALMVKPALKSTLKQFDTAQYGGAPLLGLNGLVVKTHGSSKAAEIKNTILQCAVFQEQDINQKIKTYIVQKQEEQEEIDMEFEKIKAIIAEVLNVDENEITMETTFTDDLGADSLDVFQIIMGLEEEFDIEIANEDAEKIVTVGDAVEQIKNALA